MYDFDSHIAELYDQLEKKDADLHLITELIGQRKNLRIFEPFCGTGRLLIPLIQAGHELHGMDSAAGMLSRAHAKMNALSSDEQARTHLQQTDIFKTKWPQGLDVVLLAGNCFYELGHPAQQSSCIAFAAQALKPGGFLFVDNNHHPEDVLTRQWRTPGEFPAFPSGACQDGTQFESTKETIEFNIDDRIVVIRRRTRVTHPDGTVSHHETFQQKHPVSQQEVSGWLEEHGFEILHCFGDYNRTLFIEDSNRAIFWAVKS